MRAFCATIRTAFAKLTTAHTADPAANPAPSPTTTPAADASSLPTATTPTTPGMDVDYATPAITATLHEPSQADGTHEQADVTWLANDWLTASRSPHSTASPTPITEQDWTPELHAIAMELMDANYHIEDRRIICNHCDEVVTWLTRHLAERHGMDVPVFRHPANRNNDVPEVW